MNKQQTIDTIETILTKHLHEDPFTFYTFKVVSEKIYNELNLEYIEYDNRQLGEQE